MAISLIKEFKQKQKISLTPLLKKSIDLLQLSRYELIQKIDQEIEVNPFVEKEIAEEFDFDKKYNESDFDFNVAAVENLKESLIKQVNDLRLDNNQKEIALTLVECIDESGQLIDELEEVDEMLSYKYSIGDINNVLKNVIQSLEPAGIGFRDFKECIKIQINSKKLNKKIKELCQKILTQNSSESVDEIINTFSKSGYSTEDINKAMHEIKSCDLSPGLNYESTNYIIPDLKIELKEKSFSVNFIDDTFPKIKIDNDLIEKTNTQLKNKLNKKLSEKIQDARWLLSSIKKRNDTDVSRRINLQKQISFLQDNPLKINPLSNKSLSDEQDFIHQLYQEFLRSKI